MQKEKRRSRFRRKIISVLLGFSALFVLAILLTGIWFVVFSRPSKEISQENIEKILAVESPVFFRDGVNKIGVIFEESHRQYIPFDRIPKDFINAVVAAEDRNFFTHHGVDLGAIFRALTANIRSGRVVQGGSTITQQTAKNLFNRKDRSVPAKLQELLWALRLERTYPKEKIFEFYANQFYVSGNGRGLGVAARYFFNKDVTELDTLESAFIAGSVKSPNHYNPFIKSSEEEAAKARMSAKQRTGYVLGNMYKLGMISEEQYRAGKDLNIPFQRGEMAYSLNTIMDTVKEAIATPEIEEALTRYGIDNVATSGVQIITTVDKAVQDAAEAYLRKGLSRLDVQLKGYESTLPPSEFQAPGDIRVGNFMAGTVISFPKSGENSLYVSLPSALGRNAQARVDEKGLANIANPRAQWGKGQWARPDEIKKLLGKIKEGDQVLVSVREINPLTDEILLDLEKYPEVQGAALVLQEGKIRAMTGGFLNIFFNRAIAAKRPMGSVIKPLVYCAAIQLGWNNTDILNNERNVFIFQNQHYFPRPDHESPHPEVSMSWAGVLSENVATVWLLYHLCDHLSPVDFKQLSSKLGLERGREESYGSYANRIRDEFGIIVGPDVLLNAAFEKGITSIRPDLIFAGREGESHILKNMWYGAHFEDFLAAEEKEALTYETPGERKEFGIRKNILGNNFLYYWGIRQQLMALSAEAVGNDAGLRGEILAHLFYNPIMDRWGYFEKNPGDGWKEAAVSEIKDRLLSMNNHGDFLDDILIEGRLSVFTIDLLYDTIEKEYNRLAALPAYDQEVLHQVREFRVLVGLKYLIALCREMGIESRLEPVLSFPLGSNVISLLEAARAYGSLFTGAVCQNETVGRNIIESILTSDGEMIYTPQQTKKKVVDDKTTISVSDILRNVVKFGTGRHADESVRLMIKGQTQLPVKEIRMPVLGKTGTANRYTNAAFVGCLPRLREKDGLATLDGGYVLAVYVGYDDNRPMTRGATRIAGATGALPIWTQLANAMLRTTDFVDRVDTVDLSFSGPEGIALSYPEIGQISLAVSRENGLALSGEALMDNRGATAITFGAMSSETGFRPDRYFQPFWLVEGK